MRSKISGAVLALLVASAALAQTKPQQFPIPGHGSLNLNVPTGTQVAERPVNDPPAVAIRIIPAMGDAWHLQITAVRLDPARASKAPPIKDRVQRTADGLLARALEKQATLVELRGRDASGYYFSLTDRESKNMPDDYKYLTQGSATVGELTLVFTFLYREPNNPQKDEVLRMLADAVHAGGR